MDYIDKGIFITFWLSKAMPFVLLAVLAFNLVQRIFRSGWNRKRFATFYMTCLVGALCVVLLFFKQYTINDLFLIPVGIAAVVVVIAKRKDFFPFSVRCAKCGTGLSIKAILFADPGLCPACTPLPENKSEDTRS